MTRASVTHYFIDMTAVSYPDLARILNKASGRDNIMIFYDKSCSLVKIKMLTGKHEKLNISYHDSGHDIHAYLASCMGFVLGAAQYLNDRYVVIAGTFMMRL